jgi:hypothetical protein
MAFLASAGFNVWGLGLGLGFGFGLMIGAYVVRFS